MLFHQAVFRTKWICYIHALSKVLALYLLLSKVTVWGFPGGSTVNNPPTMQEIQELKFDPWEEDPLKEGITIHSSILGRKIPSTEEPGGLQSMELPRVKRD